MICLKSNSKLPHFPQNMLFRISLIEGSGTKAEVHLCRWDNLVGSMDGHHDDSRRKHSLYWKIETIPAITWGSWLR